MLRSMSYLLVVGLMSSLQGQSAPERPRAASLPAQTLTDDVILPPSGKALVGPCGTTLVCPATFASMRSYVPTSLTPNKDFRVNFVIVQKADGSGNWTNSPTDIAALHQLVTWANDYFYQAVCVPSDPCPGVVYPTDSHIRLDLQHIYFLQSDPLWASSTASSLLAAVVAAHPDALQQLNIFATGASGSGVAAFASMPSSDRSYDQAVVMLNNTSGMVLQYAMVGTLVHELGHVFGLLHMYAGCCSPETGTVTSCDYLDDVFCPPTNPYPQTDTWGCDPTLAASVNSCTNNMMGGVMDACLFSPLQLGRIHRSLSITSAQKYVEPTVCMPPPGGMTLWLPFDEPYGTIALNPPGTPGAQVGNPTRIAGKADRALQFDGASQYVDVPSYAGVNFGTNNFTLEAWIQPAGNAPIQVIAEKRIQLGGAYHGYSFFLFNGRLGLQMADGSYANFLAPSSVPADGNWHHVAVVVSRHAALGGIFYVDGLPVSTFDPRGRPLSLNNTNVFRVGSDTLSTSSFFKGGIDEVVAYTRALSATEIQAIFAAQGDGRCKQNCSTPNVRFGRNQTAVAVNGQICNATAVPRAVMYWYESTPSATCMASDAVDGPPTFGSCSGFITVPAGTCVRVPTSVPRPPGFNNTGNNICYRLAIQSLGNDDVANVRCEGILADYSAFPKPPTH